MEDIQILQSLSQNKNTSTVTEDSLKNKTNESNILEAENDEKNDDDIAKTLKFLLLRAGIPQIDEQLLLKGLLNIHKHNSVPENTLKSNVATVNKERDETENTKPNNLVDLGESEKDFIKAYNALTTSSPIPNIEPTKQLISQNNTSTDVEAKSHKQHVIDNSNSKLTTVHRISKGYHSSSSSDQTHAKKLKNSKKNVSNPNDNSKENLTSDKKGYSKNNVSNNIEVNKEDRTKNLSDIVDNTQKIIQQMKDEINYDINSYDEENSKTAESGDSSSEAEFSSEGSSYGGNDESDDLTSDNNEPSSKSEKLSSNKHNMVNRTSSEDNEQYEEAIDHIEPQTDDIKQLNMEKLDSIVRSLREEHTISIINHPKKEDLNNNISSVNTFEEIYEELNKSENHEVTLEIKTMHNNYEPKKVKNVVPIDNYKENIHMIMFRPESPKKLSIMNIDLKNMNAVLSQIIETVNNQNTAEEKSIQPYFKNIIKIDNHNITEENHNIESNEIETNSSSETETTVYTVVPTEDENQIQDKMQEVAQHTFPLSRNSSYENVSSDNELHSNDFNESRDINNENKTNESHNINIEKMIATNIAMKSNIPNNTRAGHNKSNIPKPVKILSANKQKQDKIATKQIISKVPVRKISVKQYPAPSPPKSPFGNIQSGHVKQLQTRLLNKNIISTGTISSLVQTPTISSTAPTKVKKKAPEPPTTEQTHKLSTPPQSPSPKKHFFRETCRTEDEWTESDEESTARLSPKQNNIEDEVPSRSPPPPPTVRRVSGQIIDLATVKLLEGSPEVFFVIHINLICLQ